MPLQLQLEGALGGQVEGELLGVGILELVPQGQHEVAQMVIPADLVVILDRERHALRQEVCQAAAELEGLLPHRIETTHDGARALLLRPYLDHHVRVGRSAATVCTLQA